MKDNILKMDRFKQNAILKYKEGKYDEAVSIFESCLKIDS